MPELEIENIAGVLSGEAEIDEGLNVVRAENWQGKSSFMKAIQVVMGTTGLDNDEHPLTDGTSEGMVRLKTGEGSYETRLVRSGQTVHREGDVYLTDEQDQVCARLFAFLGETNPVREAVRNGSDLASLLTRPLDIENIDEQLANLKRERRAVETELERAEEAAEQTTQLQSAVTQLRDEIGELEAQRDELEPDSPAKENTEKQDELSDKRAQREQLTNQIERLQNKIERQERRLEERDDELAGLTVPDDPDLTGDIEQKQTRIQELETNINILEDLYRVNKRIVDEGKTGLVTDVERSIAGDELSCWVCGTDTSKATVSERLAEIDTQLKELRSEKNDLQVESDEIQERRDEIRQRKRRKTDLESEIGELKATLDENRSRLTELEGKLEELTDELETLRDDVEETNDQLTEVKSEIKYKQNELEEREAALETAQREAESRHRLQEEKEDLTAEIESLRRRRKEKNRELIEQFDRTMQDIIDAFEPGFESARLDPKTDAEGRIGDFDLVVAREGRETGLDALSEGEVELLGIVTALAGYETFDVSERVPFILLDGLTALSSSNYVAVVEYLSDRAAYLVTTAYPEIGDIDGHVVSPQNWQVVSDQQLSMS